jgi:hypothetical protein
MAWCSVKKSTEKILPLPLPSENPMPEKGIRNNEKEEEKPLLSQVEYVRNYSTKYWC